MNTNQIIEVIDSDNQKEFSRMVSDGLDPNIMLDEVPLIFYILNNIPMLKLLLDKGVNINCCMLNKSYTPLIMALRQKNFEAANLLLDKNPDLTLVSFAGLDALFYAVEAEDENIIKRILAMEKDKKYLMDTVDLCKKRNLPENGIKIIEKHIKEL